jgi:hypothetical protein
LVRCPTTELDSPLGANPTLYRQDRLDPVRVHQPRNLSISHGLNYPEFPDSCFGRVFLIVVKPYWINIYIFGNVGTLPEFWSGHIVKLPRAENHATGCHVRVPRARRIVAAKLKRQQ